MLTYKTKILTVHNTTSINVGFNCFHIDNTFINLHSKLKWKKKELELVYSAYGHELIKYRVLCQ